MKKFLILFLIFFSSVSYTQSYELGEVKVEELKEKKHPLDSLATAAVLFKKGTTKFRFNEDTGFSTITEVEVKIKIYKKEGLSYANQTIDYLAQGSSKENVTILNASTFNLNNDKIEKVKLKSEGEFDEKINKFWSRKKITFPNVKEGSIIEFKYKITSKNLGKLNDWRFQESIPVNYSEYITHIPDYFVYNPYFKGYILPTIVKDVKQNKFEGTYYDSAGMGSNGTRTKRANYSLDFKENINKYFLKNIPAIVEEKYVNNIENYFSTLQLELSSFVMPNYASESFSTNWETVCTKIYEMPEFAGELNKNDYFEDDVKTLLEGVSERDEKIRLILNYVKTKVKWNGFSDYFCHDGVKIAYKKGIGNVAEINLMLIAMLRYAGIDTNPVLVSTRSNGIALFPSINAFNYVIAAVEIENDVILLDATELYSVPNLLPERAINWNGRIIRKNGSSADVNLNPNYISKEITNILLNINTEGKIEGKIRKQKGDYNAYLHRINNGSISENDYLEKLGNKLNDCEISDYKVEGKSELNKPIVETFSFVNSNEIEKIGDKIYIHPLFFFRIEQNPFKQIERKYPVDFTFPQQDKYQIIISLPENYEIDSLPSVLNLGFSDKSMGYLFNISNSGNQIHVMSQLDLKTNIVSQDDYEELKEFFTEVVKKQSEKIVLKKK